MKNTNSTLLSLNYDGKTYYFSSRKGKISSVWSVFSVVKSFFYSFSGTLHPDRRRFEMRPAYRYRCPSIVKAENKRINAIILKILFAIIYTGLCSALICFLVRG